MIRSVRLSEQQPAPKPRRTVEELYGVTCDSSGCTDDAQPREPGDEGRYCRRHQLVSVFG